MDIGNVTSNLGRLQCPALGTRKFQITILNFLRSRIMNHYIQISNQTIRNGKCKLYVWYLILCIFLQCGIFIIKIIMWYLYFIKINNIIMSMLTTVIVRLHLVKFINTYVYKHSYFRCLVKEKQLTYKPHVFWSNK